MFQNAGFLFVVFIIAVALAGGVVAFMLFILKQPNPQLPGQPLTVGNTQLRVEVAKSMTERARGLSGRQVLGANEGMYFVFDKPDHYGFWMKDMLFAIDMIWIKDGRVVGFSENAAPEPKTPLWSLKIYYPPDTADAVLEVNAGFVAAHQIKVGDAVALQ